MADFVAIDPSVDQAAASVVLQGDWVLAHLATIETELQTLPEQADLRMQIGALDTAGALLLSGLLTRYGLEAETAGLQSAQLDLLRLVQDVKIPAGDTKPSLDPTTRIVTSIGQTAVTMWATCLDLLRFIGETVVTLAQTATNPKQLRVTSLIRHIRETGINAIPIVSLIAFLISVVLAYQGANQLQRFGAEIFTINMVAISVLREMGVLLTAIMIAGRSGSAFTAEIGVMKVNEEVDAMRIIGVSPFEFLVLPRLLALMITLPLLTFIADMMGLLGGGLISKALLDIGFEPYLDRFKLAVQMKDFWVGIIKAPVFAFFIAVVGCMRGLQVSGSAESVGRLTTISVVQSIFLVLLLDALFSILFTKLGI